MTPSQAADIGGRASHLLTARLPTSREALEARALELTKLCGDTDGLSSLLRTRRAEVFGALVALGVSRGDIARLVGMSTVAVSKILATIDGPLPAA